MPLVAPRGRLSTLQFEKFDGGLNLRDAPTEVAPNETPDCMNVTLDERGGFEARLGLSKLNGASSLPAAPNYLYYSSVADALLAYISTHSGNGRLYKSTNAGVTWSEVTWTPGPPLFTSAATAAIHDFKNRVVVVNTLDGVYSFPSDLSTPTRTTGGSANMEEVRGDAIAVWQNKVWITGDIREDSTHSRARVWFSNAGNEQLWTVASAFIDIRDVDTEKCTAIGAGVGMDVTGKPSLLVFKERSYYRINDATTGAYTTLHSKGAGAASNKAVATNLGRICSINREGIWVTDGIAIPIRVSDKLQPLFSADGLNFATFDKWAAAPYRDRVVFNVCRNGSATPNLTLEYHPEIGWTVPHALALGPYAVFTKQTTKLIAADPDGGEIYEAFKGGTDDGTAIPARYLAPAAAVADGNEGRLRYLRVYGRGACTVQIRLDFAAFGEDYPMDFDEGSGFVWGTDDWDEGIWGEPAIEAPDDTALDQVCKYVSVMFSNSTTVTSFRPPLLGDGVGSEAGAWAVYGATIDHVQLGT